MQKVLRLNATTRSDRHQIIELVKDAIASSGGWVLDFKFFSNVSICLNFELPHYGVERLKDSLAEVDLQFSDESRKYMADFIGQSASPEEEITGALHITFIHEEPDLRIPVPAIPG